METAQKTEKIISSPRDITLLRSQLMELNPYRKSDSTLSKRRSHLYEMISSNAEVQFSSIKRQKVLLKDLKHLNFFKNCEEKQFQNHLNSAFKNISKYFRKTTYWSAEIKIGETLTHVEIKGKESFVKRVHYGLTPEEISKIQNQVFSKAAYSISNKPILFKNDLDNTNYKSFKTETVEEFVSRGGKIKICRPSNKARTATMRFWKIL